ncbi:MAG: hypothetical protein GKS05_03070 [Nitrospirales bacterium]|nr:hypothetical protein [Nitrospirales bacterium]
MKTLLALLSKSSNRDDVEFIPFLSNTDTVLTVILIQEGIHLTQSPSDKTYVLEDDLTLRNGHSTFPKISYRDMVTMIFDADTVIAL